VTSLDRQIVALVNVDALRALGAVMQDAPVARLAPAVIPAGHIETRGRLMTSMQITGTLIQIEFATVADVTASTRAPSRCHAFATVLTRLIAHSYKKKEFYFIFFLF